MTKLPKELTKMLKQINGIMNKIFNPFDRSILKYIEKIENVECYTIALTQYEDIAKVVTTDKKEYIIFQDVPSAIEYAIACSRYEDDPNLITVLKRLNSNVEDHYRKRVYAYGAEHILSFDNKHKLELPNGSVAYRTL